MFIVDISACIGCAVCMDLCPEGAISLTEDQTAQIDPQKCVTCGFCLGVCTQEAIEATDQA
ncbi:MAG: 4Fe-4S binding protein [Dethiobacter sp.]|nr:4Fe-4S binding protein [Dethiobacter sp.]